MAIAERKAREFAGREQLILDAAKRLFGEYGYEGVSMDQIAEAVEYSKGVLYKHFQSKEELYMALCASELDALARAFESAVGGGGTARERLIRIGELYVQECQRDPNWFLGRFQLGESPRNSKQSRSDRRILEQCFGADDRCLRVVADVVRQGQEAGEIRRDVDAQQAAVSLWADTLGFMVLASSNEEGLIGWGLDLVAAMRRSWDFLLDGISTQTAGG